MYSDRQELGQAEQDIVTKSGLQSGGETSAEQRAQAIVDVKHLAERVGRLKEEIRQLESDQVVYRRDLDDYQAALPASR